MMALIDGPGYTDATGKTVFTYAHPLFWAPYTHHRRRRASLTTQDHLNNL